MPDKSTPIKVEIIKTNHVSLEMPLIGSMEAFIPGEDFEAYEDRLMQYFLINEVQEDKKVPLFITVMGGETYKILKSLSSPTAPSALKFSEIVNTLKQHFKPKVNKRAERFKFSKSNQEQGESISEFIVKLKSLAQSCEFGTFLDDALTDKFIVGLRSEEIQQELLQHPDVKFDKCCERALNIEMSVKEVKSMNPSVVCHYISQTDRTRSRHRSQSNQSRQSQGRSDSVSSPSARYRHNQSPTSSYRQIRNPSPQNQNVLRSNCSRCGRYSHHESKCPAKHWQCYSCYNYGHTSKVCRIQSRGGTVKIINSINQQNQPAECIIQIESQEVSMEVDTGACSSVISLVKYRNSFSYIRLNQVNESFSTVTGQIIKVVGKITVDVVFRTKACKLELIVVDSEREFKPLLGRSWLDVVLPEWKVMFMGLTTSYSVNNLTTNDILERIKMEFPNVMDCESVNQRIEGFKVDILLEEGAKPIFHKGYTVAYQLRPKVEAELARLCELDILEPVKFSNWASPIVSVPKTNGEIRVCVDFKVTVNKMVKTEHYPLPRVDDIFASLANCNYFCVIDLTGAYQQLLVSEESREYLTINTHRGLFRYKRLPFGLKSAPSIFQSIMDQILSGLEGVVSYLDDILVGGKDYRDCRNKLWLVLETLNRYKVQINLSKCKLLSPSVEYLGHTLSADGIRPNNEKIQAIVNAPAPTNVSQLQSFLGLLNYYGKFIPNLSTNLVDLYYLLKKDVKFEWSASCQSAFEKCKSLILKHNLLELYDPDKPIVIATDASPYGVGAILSHLVNGVEKPVLFVSSTLSPAERNYSQLHREALAIVFGIKKFHKYIYGHEFVIQTDHQALREIFNPNKSTPPVAAARLQRWAVILSMYNYRIEYRRGSEMSHVDALSRLPVQSKTNIDSNLCIKSFNFTDGLPLKLENIVTEMEKDICLSQVINFCMYGWPDSHSLSEELKVYFNKRDYLSCEDKCLYYMNRVVIPRTLSSKVLGLLHENHAVGIVRMKMIARSYVWWFKIDRDIEHYVNSCIVCQQSRNVPKEVVKTSWPEAIYPFQRIHIDFFKFENNSFLIIVDAFTKFLEIILMKITTASAVITALDKTFSIFGLPNEIVSDNGPPFGSFEFLKFAEKFNIQLTKSPPYHPESNGLAERNVQTVKSVLSKFLLGETKQLTIQQRLNKFLTQQRNSPCMSTSKTPSEMLFSYKPKILLDLINPKKVQFSLDNNNQEKTNNKIVTTKEKSKKNERDKQICKNFVRGDKVLFQNHFRSYVKWVPAIVLKKVSPLTFLINVNNHVRFVHVNHLRVSQLEDKFHPNLKIVCPEERSEKLDMEQEKEMVITKNQTERNKKRQRSVVDDVEIRKSTRVRKSPDRLKY